MNIDQMQSHINVALIDSTIKALTDLRSIEMAMKVMGERPKDAEHKSKLAAITAVNAMNAAMRYLRGDFSVADGPSMTRAQELMEKEPEFLAVAEENQRLKKELEKLRPLDPAYGKPFKCRYCKGNFKSKAALTRHMKKCKEAD